MNKLGDGFREVKAVMLEQPNEPCPCKIVEREPLRPSEDEEREFKSGSELYRSYKERMNYD